MSDKVDECPLCGANQESMGFHYDGQFCECGWATACDPDIPVHRFTPQERDAILAGLSLLTDALRNGELNTEINDIYTNSDRHEGLGIKDIDHLCTRINR